MCVDGVCQCVCRWQHSEWRNAILKQMYICINVDMNIHVCIYLFVMSTHLCECELCLCECELCLCAFAHSSFYTYGVATVSRID